mgnify:CR=1 FL=1
MAKNTENKETLVQSLAEKLSTTADASHVYGKPVVNGDVTIVPVAKAAFGFGGGSGNEGEGGGGGMRVTPVGYIELKQGETRFKSIKDPQTIIKAIAIGGLFAYLTVKSITGAMQPAKKAKKRNKKKK